MKNFNLLNIGFIILIVFLTVFVTSMQESREQDYYFFGTGAYNYILIPKNISVSSVYKYSGNFKTKLRLRHLVNYSNEFEGYLNLGEFEEYHTKENGFRVIKNKF